jgi:hypothetical protein
MLIVPLVAWGEHHVRMARYCIASLWAEGNLPDVESRLQIYTDTPEAFKGYAEVYPIALRPEQQKHHLTAECYERAMTYGHPIVPVASDMVCSKGMLSAIEKHVGSKRLVVVPVPRVDAAKMIEAIPLYDEVVNLSSRDLCRLSLSRIHPHQLEMFGSSRTRTAQPTTVFRRDGDTIIARCFHMHPIMMQGFAPGMANKCERSGIDAWVVDEVPHDQIHVVTDSDEMMVVDLTDAEYDWEPGWKGVEIDPLNWAARKTNRTHRWFFTHECYLHAGERRELPRDPWIEDFCEKVNAWR